MSVNPNVDIILPKTIFETWCQSYHVNEDIIVELQPIKKAWDFQDRKIINEFFKPYRHSKNIKSLRYTNLIPTINEFFHLINWFNLHGIPFNDYRVIVVLCKAKKVNHVLKNTESLQHLLTDNFITLETYSAIAEINSSQYRRWFF